MGVVCFSFTLLSISFQIWEKESQCLAEECKYIMSCDIATWILMQQNEKCFKDILNEA